ncbi:unnamed protein product [Effrenium voratum]|uniref:carbonic anhydrase n=1 Tax=Effrenium voratum TaxID=2562239 RepID=A0AA36NEN8_9DINO|nr:unnamed protein product [Effrenium voratum]
MVFAQLADAFSFCTSPDVRHVRTTADPPMAPEESLKMLKGGNRRFVDGRPLGARTKDAARRQLVDQGQAPHTAIIGCADSRAPLETIFDAMPGDLFVLRNAGNTCTHAEGSMVGSLEFATGKLGSRLILVLGHTNCGAIAGATKTYLEAKVPQKAGSALQGLLQDLGAVAEQAVQEAGPGASADEVTARAVKVNVYHTMSFLLRFSESIRSAVREGTVQIQGGIYNLETGSVDFLGALPTQTELLDSTMAIPPSMVEAGEARGKHGVRTGADSAVPKDVALKMLKAGNERFAAGAPTATQTSGPMRKVNVFSSMNFLLKYSEPIRELVRKGDLDIQGGIYHLETGRVEFLGRSPQQAELLAAEGTLPPSMALGTVRTTSDGPMAPQAALKLLKVGNERFVVGAPKAGKVHSSMRETLATGQAPHTALVGCADSRVPLETVFDALPGDLFVLRNAGNTCTHAEGSVLGSLEFCTGPLKTRLIFVLGHTSCGAIKGATSTFLSGQKTKVPQALDALLQGLGSVVSDAQKELGKKATEEQVAAHAVKLNVFHTMNFMLKYSEPIRQKVRSGELEIQGGVYDLQTGRVEFLGASPSQAKLVAAEGAVAPSLKSKMQGA